MQGAANEMDGATSRKSRNQREQTAGIRSLRWGFLRSKTKKIPRDAIGNARRGLMWEDRALLEVLCIISLTRTKEFN
jgi:hypothetical protein